MMIFNEILQKFTFEEGWETFSLIYQKKCLFLRNMNDLKSPGSQSLPSFISKTKSLLN